MPLPSNSTLRTVAPQLKDPIEFVRRVLASMTGLQRDCQVRLLLTSDPRYPDYQVEDFVYDDEGGEQNQIPIPAKIVRGRSQKELDYDNEPIPDEWSDEVMHYSEVQVLLGELRNSRRG